MWRTKTAGGLDLEYATVKAPLNGMERHQSRRKGIQGLIAGARPVDHSVEYGSGYNST